MNLLCYMTLYYGLLTVVDEYREVVTLLIGQHLNVMKISVAS